jgi:hypothetical protein
MSRSADDQNDALGDLAARALGVRETATDTDTPPENMPGFADALEAYYRRYAVLGGDHHYVALVLWCAHTYAFDAFDTTPRLFLDSAVPGSGKTRVLELLEHTALAPLQSFNASAAALIRTIDAGQRTVLLDEVDMLYSKSGGYEDITATINAGYKKGSTVPRCVGVGMEIDVVELSAFAPMALAGLHANVPDAVRSRSIHFRMRKRKPTEPISPYRQRTALAEASEFRRGLSAWVADVRGKLQDAMPVLPAGVEDRAAEVWEPLVAIADEIGGSWPERARAACAAFVFAKRADTPSLGVEMLATIRELMDGAERVSTAQIIASVGTMGDRSPWPERMGHLTPQALANLLAPFDVAPRQFKLAGRKERGYGLYGDGGLIDAFERYLTSESDNVSDGDLSAETPSNPPKKSPLATPKNRPATARKTRPESRYAAAVRAAGIRAAGVPATRPPKDAK